ncbi:MAG TPA: 50S ribosomal protein L10 [Spirochaetia bacterium]|nr:MAG: 50S ribosomal protein L10 [Spirochaetes bacterium GWB1_36_13]HCL58198.1 50S ribosomal protein L10 [Spirochaetia bacterium]
MPSKKNKEALVQLDKVLNQYPDFFITEFRGLTVADITGLRTKLRETGCVYQIVKNNILKIALNNKSIAELDSVLVGPNAVLFAADPISAAKVLKEFLKEKANTDKLKIKAGVSEGKIVDSAYINQLGDLPSKEELLSRLLRVLNNPVQKLAVALKAIADKEEQ